MALLRTPRDCMRPVVVAQFREDDVNPRSPDAMTEFTAAVTAIKSSIKPGWAK